MGNYLQREYHLIFSQRNLVLGILNRIPNIELRTYILESVGDTVNIFLLPDLSLVE